MNFHERVTQIDSQAVCERVEQTVFELQDLWDPSWGVPALLVLTFIYLKNRKK